MNRSQTIQKVRKTMLFLTLQAAFLCAVPSLSQAQDCLNDSEAPTIDCATASPQNQLANSSFESNNGHDTQGFENWTQFGTAFALDRNILGTAQEGDFFVKMFGGNTGLFQDFPVSPGDNITGSVFMQNASFDPTGAGAGGQIKLEWLGQPGLGLETSPFLTSAAPQDVWTEFSASGVAPPGATGVRFVLICNLGGGAIMYDNASLINNSAPGSGLVGDVSVDNDPGACGAELALATPSTADNCAVASITNDFTGTDNASGFYPIGTTTVTWTVTDNASGDLPDVAVLSAADVVNAEPDVIAKLIATGAFNSVVGIDVAVTTPSLATLQQYDAVLVWNDDPFANEVDFGNVLAAYIDAGGGVVVSMFTQWIDSPYPFVGDFGDNGYLPLDGSGGIGLNDGPHTMNILDGSHPIMEGVSTFDGGTSSFRGTNLSLQPAATLLANWSTGDPLIAFKEPTNGRTVSLNFFPPSSDVTSPGFWNVNSDGDVIMANSLLWASGDESTGNTTTCSVDITVTDTEAPTLDCGAVVNSGNVLNAPSFEDAAGNNTAYNSSAWSRVGLQPFALDIPTLQDGNFYVKLFGENTSLSQQHPVVEGDEIEASVWIKSASFDPMQPACEAFIRLEYDNGDVVESERVNGTIPQETWTQITLDAVAPVGATSVDYVAAMQCPQVGANSGAVMFDDASMNFISLGDGLIGDVNVDNDPGQCGAELNLAVPTVGDNCPEAILVNDYNGTGNASDFYPVGTTTVTYTVTDASGNASSCSIDVTVNDNEAPEIICASNGARDTDPGTCDYAVVGTEFDASFSDNCIDASLTNDYNNASSLAGAVFPQGTTTVTWTAALLDIAVLSASDVSGAEADVVSQLTSTGAFNSVTSIDVFVETPTLATLQEYDAILVWNDDPFANAVDFGNILAEYVDNGGGVVVSMFTQFDNNVLAFEGDLRNNGYLPLNGSGGLGQNGPISMNIVDGTHPIMEGVSTFTGGNSSFRATNLTVQPDATLLANWATGEPLIAFKEPSNGRTVSLNFFPPSSNARGDFWDVNTDGTAIMANSLLWASNDESIGNETTCSVDITVNDTEAPTIICSPPEAQNLLVNGSFETNNGNDSPVGPDWVQFGSVFTIDENLNGTAQDGNFFLKMFGGNSGIFQDFPVSPGDNITGTAFMQNASFDPTGAGDGGQLKLEWLGAPGLGQETSSFLTSAATQDVWTEFSASGVAPAGATGVRFVLICNLTDGAVMFDNATLINNGQGGNEGVGGDVSVHNDPGSCGAQLSLAVPVIDDNCSGAVLMNDFNGTADASDFYPIGATTVNWTVTDAAGLTSVCTVEVTVVDVEAPVIDCPADITVDNDPGQCGAVVEFAAATANDNCSATVDYSIASGSFFEVGTTAVTATAVDAAGNETTCTFNVTVVDAEAPAVDCPADITVDNDPGQCGAVVEFAAATANDNCSATVDYSIDSGSLFEVGTTAVTATAVDAAGNETTCTFNVTVVDAEAPAVDCTDLDVSLDLTGFAEVTIDDFSDQFADNCGISSAAIVSGQTVFGCVDEGNSFPIEIEVADEAGNISTCNTTVHITVASDEDGDGISDQCDFCFGDNANGDADLDGICDTPVSCAGFEEFTDSDQECDVTSSFNAWWFSASDGLTHCFEGPFSGGTIYVSNGSTVRLSGTGHLNVIVGWHGSLEVLDGSDITFNNLQVGWGSEGFVIYPDATVEVAGDFHTNGPFVNCGSFTSQRFQVNFNGSAINSGTIEVDKSMRLIGHMENHGLVTVYDDLTLNFSGELTNYCEIQVGDDFKVFRNVHNYAFINVADYTAIYFTGRVNLYDRAMHRTGSSLIYGRYVGNGSQSLVKVLNNTIAYWNGRIDGNLAYCDADGFEAVFTNTLFINGAEDSCLLDVAITDCNPEGHAGFAKSGFAQTKDKFDLDEIEELLADSDVPETLAEESELSVWPNPTRDYATLSYTAASKGRVVMELYSTSGQHVATLFEGVLEKGTSMLHEIDGRSLPNGMYFVRITESQTVLTERFVIAD